MSEWISVEDKLPPKDKDDKDWSIPVLYYHYNILGWMYVGMYSFKDKCWSGTYGNLNNLTTHWMPLPNPPKEVV